MKRIVIYILLPGYLFLSCQQKTPTDTNESDLMPEEMTQSLDVLLENDRVAVGPIQEQLMKRTIQCVGRIEMPPTAITAVHARRGGQIHGLKYLPGDFVKRGALIARVENPEFIEKQRKLLETRAELTFAKKDYERKKLLKEGQATPEKTFDESQKQYELLGATYQGLKTELELLGVDIGALENEGNFQASIPLYANQSGYIHEVLVNQGQMITPETRILDIANVNFLHLELQVLSKDIGFIQTGQTVQFTIPNRSETYLATIEKLNPMLDHEGSSRQAHCRIDHAEKEIFVPGLFANAMIQTEEVSVQGLPLSGVIKEGETYFGYLVDGNTVAKTQLSNAQVLDQFVTFDGSKDGNWIIEGAYYIE